MLNTRNLVVLANTRILFVLIVLLGISSSGFATVTDIYCLKTFQNSLEDPLESLRSWYFDNDTEGFVCGFEGIECWHPDENRVLDIHLSNMGLSGKFPRGIENCSSLTGLDLSHNNLSGPIPSDISERLQFVTKLDLSSNSFSGKIPASLANCTYLNELRLDHNQLNGSIPLQIGQLNRITNFSVSNNFLSGPVPNFGSDSMTAESYANNTGLCGPLLSPCPARERKSLGGIIAIAAVGGVTFTAVVVAIVTVTCLKSFKISRAGIIALGTVGWVTFTAIVVVAVVLATWFISLNNSCPHEGRQT